MLVALSREHNIRIDTFYLPAEALHKSGDLQILFCRGGL